LSLLKTSIGGDFWELDFLNGNFGGSASDPLLVMMKFDASVGSKIITDT
jgi:hypothetical protein